jgi:probable HAF family extracellular repeat protein
MTQRITLALLLLLGAALAGPVEYTFIPLPQLHPDRGGWGFKPNDVRQVSGWAQTPDLPRDRALLWDVAADNSATLTDIGLVAGRRMFGRGLNNQGHMVGFSFVTGNGEFAFRWTGGTPVELENAFDTLDTGAFHSAAIEINDGGWASGSASTSVIGPYHAVLWDPAGAMHDLGTLGGTQSIGFGVNERNMASGYSGVTSDDSVVRAFRWDPEADAMEALDILRALDHITSIGHGLNNHGDVAGTSSEQPFAFGPNTLGVIWYADGSVQQLDAIGVPGTDDIMADPWDINDACWVCGSSYKGIFPSWNAHPVLWTPDGSVIDFMPLMPEGTVLATANGISNTGWISGAYRLSGETIGRPYVLRPTPATQIGMLMDQVDRLDLGRIGRGLNLQLKVALDRIEDSKPHVAEKLLKVFAFEVKLLERFRKLDDIETGSLLAVVNDAAAALKGE